MNSLNYLKPVVELVKLEFKSQSPYYLEPVVMGYYSAEAKDMSYQTLCWNCFTKVKPYSYKIIVDGYFICTLCSTRLLKVIDLRQDISKLIIEVESIFNEWKDNNSKHYQVSSLIANLEFDIEQFERYRDDDRSELYKNIPKLLLYFAKMLDNTFPWELLV